MPLMPVSRWGVIAKTCGGLLNPNCALLLVRARTLLPVYASSACVSLMVCRHRVVTRAAH
jgi:hypothetical protein